MERPQTLSGRLSSSSQVASTQYIGATRLLIFPPRETCSMRSQTNEMSLRGDFLELQPCTLATLWLLAFSAFFPGPSFPTLVLVVSAGVVPSMQMSHRRCGRGLQPSQADRDQQRLQAQHKPLAHVVLPQPRIDHPHKSAAQTLSSLRRVGPVHVV